MHALGDGMAAPSAAGGLRVQNRSLRPAMQIASRLAPLALAVLLASSLPSSQAQWFYGNCPSGVGDVILSEVYQSGLWPTVLIGGMGGGCDVDRGLNPGSAYSASSNSFIKTLTVWPGDAMLRGMQITFYNGTSVMRGCFGNWQCQGTSGALGSPSSITFAPRETITALSLWGNGAGTRSGAIRLTTSAGQTFFVSMYSWGLKTEYPQDVGSGILAGIFSKSSADLDAIGFLFVKALARPYYISNVTMQPTPQQQAQIAGLYDTPAYVVSQVCSAAPVPPGQPPLSITCQISMTKEWTSEEMVSVTNTIGLDVSTSVSAGISFEGLVDLGTTISDMVSSSTATTNEVTTVSSVTVGFSGTITATSGQAQVASSTVQVIEMTNVPWVGQLNYIATDGSSIFVMISGTYSSALIADACTEVAMLGTPASDCTCAASCGQAVAHIIPQPVLNGNGTVSAGPPVPLALEVLPSGASQQTSASSSQQLLQGPPPRKNRRSALSPGH